MSAGDVRQNAGLQIGRRAISAIIAPQQERWRGSGGVPTEKIAAKWLGRGLSSTPDGSGRAKPAAIWEMSDENTTTPGGGGLAAANCRLRRTGFAGSSTRGLRVGSARRSCTAQCIVFARTPSARRGSIRHPPICRSSPPHPTPLRCWSKVEVRWNCGYHSGGDRISLADLMGGAWGSPGTGTPGFLEIPGVPPGRRAPLEAFNAAVIAHFKATGCRGVPAGLIAAFCPKAIFSAPDGAQEPSAAAVTGGTATTASSATAATSPVPYPATDTSGQAAIATAQPQTQGGGDKCRVLVDFGGGHMTELCTPTAGSPDYTKEIGGGTATQSTANTQIIR